ncbi:threonine-phosphate decarboxylase CobD [Sporosarcina sp. GW1-11]|uniref:threonine-phosphate decarboxylase CobD n=1 Tax=Sporosarcina sp. GW1-11 TaxID=2899126 RepID=UPI00294FA3D8|nr:threonine-phosphate decarboxylase CobD [Sporosarcina sp. GW1-11]MDV6379205.1 threonine-phosphate decarboxylase CobD [Sporosarcina sp. GW1-11]
MRLPEHGANCARLYESLNIPVPEKILDFSENCNPAGPPVVVKEAWADLLSTITSYPDPDGQPFRAVAAKFHQVEERCVLVGNGAAELLSLLGECYRGEKVLLIDPTFSEYRATLEASGAEVVSIQAKEEDDFRLPVAQIVDALPKVAAVYLCTPNNPTGILPTLDELLTIVQAAERSRTEVVLDEAFIDFVDESRSFIHHLEKYPHVIVVRSMTKMYAIPGIRLGYLVTHPEIVSMVKSRTPHWHVNGVAAEIGALCLNERSYCESAILHAQTERAKMVEFLRAYDCQVIDSVANYLIFAPKQDARVLYRYLLARGIVLRHSENFRGMDGRWLRVGMKSAEQMNSLREAMANWFEEQ